MQYTTQTKCDILTPMKTIIVFRTGVLGTWREKYNGIAAYAKSADWSLHPVDARSKKPDFKYLIEFWKPDGIIVDASGLPQMFRSDPFGSLPVVMMNPESETGGRQRPYVMSDSQLIAKFAMSELLQSNPESLAFVEWFDPSIVWSATKRAVSEKIAKMHGIPFSVITPAPGDYGNSAHLEGTIAKAIEKLPRPCGIFAVTDMTGATTISAASRIGLRLPEDVFVVSVDDDPEICESCSPSLTSVRPDFGQLGFEAGRLLDKAMGGQAGKGEHVVVPPMGLVRRASTMRTKIFDKMVNDAMEQIRLHACEGLEPKDVAAPFGLSRRMVELRFKAAVGKTIGEAIIDQRLSAACNYLKEGRVSIFAISNFCGWKSDKAFRKAFTSRFGVSPRAWRKAQS